MPTAPRDGQKSSARRYLHAPVTYVSSSKRQGCRRSTALRPTWVRLWHISSRPTPRPRLMLPWLTSRSPYPWWKRGAQCPSLRHLRRADIHVVDLIELHIASSPPSRRKSTNPRANTAQDGDLHAKLNKNKLGHDARGYIDHCHREHEEWELRSRLDYDREYDRARSSRRREQATCLVRGRLRPP
jgi:hypothetical protein